MSLATQVQALATRVATEFKSVRTLVNGNTADLSGLTTANKTTLVAAINEVRAGSTAPPAASTVTAGVVALATTAEATAGTDSGKAVTAAGVKAATDAVKTSILGAGVPAALDTLNELATALNNDASFAATMTTQLATKQDAASVGSTTTDFVATFNAGLV